MKLTLWLKQEENVRCSHHHQQAAEDEESDRFINKRMPMCVGVCVLLAIVCVGGATPLLTTDPNATSNEVVTRIRTDLSPIVTNSHTDPSCPLAMTCPTCPASTNCKGFVDPATIDMGILRA